MDTNKYINSAARSLMLVIMYNSAPLFAHAQESCSDLLLNRSATQSDYSTYRSDTQSSLNLMRNPETGLIRDKILILPKENSAFAVKVMNDNTSATNIGLDLINQLSLLKSGPQSELARVNLELIVSSLERMHFHSNSGLFFSWYSTAANLNVRSYDISSVDNIHLALGLWTVKETLPHTSLASRANRLFERMDFSSFYDERTGLIAGNFKYQNKNWIQEDYRFGNLGSEARSIYSLCWALGLLRTISDPKMPEKSVAALKAEIYLWSDQGTIRRLLRTWDGGAFQLLLPKLLINEEIYSNQLAQIFKNYADYSIAEGDRQGIAGMAYHSASQYGYDGQGAFTQVPAYHGKAGNPDLVSSDHTDINEPEHRALWDMTLTPHAAVMVASIDPNNYQTILANIKTLRSGANLMYRPGLGFMDGYHLKGVYQSQVVPVQLSLNQQMIAIALDQIGASDHLSPSARALQNNPEVSARLRAFYKLVDQKLK